MILISLGGGSIVKLEPKTVEQESFLQSYINKHPEVIPLDDLKDEARLLVLGREFPTPSGDIDVLAMDQDGDPYVIETKLFKNSDKRKVIAQCLDYGAALWDLPSDELMLSLNAVSKRQFEGIGFTQRLLDFLGEEAEPEQVTEHFLAQVEAGNITFIVLMDQIGPRLKTLIRYVNANSKFRVLGMSLDFYEYQDAEIVIPDVYGTEIRKELTVMSTSGERQKWDEESYFEKAESQLNKDELDVLHQLLDWATEQADRVKWGTGKVNGSFGPVFPNLCARTIFAAYSDANINVHIGSAKDSPDLRAKMTKLAQELENNGLIKIDREIERFMPVIPGSKLVGRVDEFVEFFKRNLEI